MSSHNLCFAQFLWLYSLCDLVGNIEIFKQDLSQGVKAYQIRLQ